MGRAQEAASNTSEALAAYRQAIDRDRDAEATLRYLLLLSHDRTPPSARIDDALRVTMIDDAVKRLIETDAPGAAHLTRALVRIAPDDLAINALLDEIEGRLDWTTIRRVIDARLSNHLHRSGRLGPVVADLRTRLRSASSSRDLVEGTSDQRARAIAFEVRAFAIADAWSWPRTLADARSGYAPAKLALSEVARSAGADSAAAELLGVGAPEAQAMLLELVEANEPRALVTRAIQLLQDITSDDVHMSGVDRDRLDSVEALIGRAVDQNYRPAMVLLARLHLSGVTSASDVGAANDLLERASEGIE